MIGSAAGSSPQAVIPRARGELLERVSNILAGRAAESGRGVIGTFTQLRRAGTAVMDPATWRELGASAPAALRQERMLWVAGTSLVTGDEILVPASAAFLHHRPPSSCSVMLRAGSTGVSAHTSWKAAVTHALREVLERDLVWRSWYGMNGPVLTLRHPPLSPTLTQALDELRLQQAVLVLPGPANTACVVVCLHTAQCRKQSFGARCVAAAGGAPLLEGIELAAYEALMVRWSMGTPVARRASQDLRDNPSAPPMGPLEHALWTFHRQNSLGHWLARAAAHHEWAAPTTIGADTTTGWNRLARLLAEDTGEDVVVVDTTTREVCGDGITVVRVVAPGAGRLPADERDAPREPHGHRALPHPFG